MVDIIIVSGVLVVAALVLGTGITHYPGFSDDEGTYTAQAWAVRTQGSLAHYTYWYDHPPLGWLQLALATWVLGPLLAAGSAVAQARSLMLLPALASVALLYLLARRLGMRRTFAAAAALVFVLSPLSVTSLRQVYLDNLATPWLLAALVLAASPKRRLWAYAGSGASFAVAVLTKETTLLLLPALVLLLAQRVDRRTRAFCLTAFASALTLGLLGYPLYALLKGELLPGRGHVSLVEAIAFQLYQRPGSGGLLTGGSAAHAQLKSWLATDPWLLSLGLAAMPLAIFRRRLRPIVLALGMLVIAAVHGGYLPQPFVIAALPFCALLIAGALDGAWRARRVPARAPWLARVVGVAGTLAVAAMIAPSWRRADSYAMHANQTRPMVAAERWIAKNVNRRARLLVDDSLYVDLVEAGFAQRYGVVWFYKLDFTTNLDPSVVRHLPDGWRAFDYVVSTRVIRSALQQAPRSLQQVRLALTHSRTVASFGSGGERVEVRRLEGPGVGSGLIPAAPPAALKRPGTGAHRSPSQRGARARQDMRRRHNPRAGR